MSTASSRVLWPGWLGALFAIILFFAAQAVAAILVGLYGLLLKGWTSNRTVSWLSDSLHAQFAYLLVTAVIIVLATRIFTRFYKTDLNIIGLRRPRPSDAIYALAAVPAYVVLLLITVSIVKLFVPGLDTSQAQDVGFNGNYHGAELALVFISLVVLPPITEEILFRGLLYSSLKKAFDLVPAAILTSLLFAAGHLPESAAGGPLYIAAIDTFVLSTLLITLREKTGGLWASIGLHALKNAIAFTYIFVLHMS